MKILYIGCGGFLVHYLCCDSRIRVVHFPNGLRGFFLWSALARSRREEPADKVDLARTGDRQPGIGVDDTGEQNQ